LLETGQCTELVSKYDVFVVGGDKGHAKYDGNENDDELQNIKNPKINPRIFKDSIAFRQSSEYAQINIHKGNSEQKDGQIVTDPRQQHEHQQGNQQI